MSFHSIAKDSQGQHHENIEYVRFSTEGSNRDQDENHRDQNLSPEERNSGQAVCQKKNKDTGQYIGQNKGSNQGKDEIRMVGKSRSRR